jgi:hypothetical protein
LAQQLQQGLQGSAAASPVKPEEVLALIEKLGALHTQGVLTEAEFTAKKTELLKKLV